MIKEEIIKFCIEKSKVFIKTFIDSFRSRESHDRNLKEIYREVADLSLNNEELINFFFFPQEVNLTDPNRNNEFNYKLFNDYVMFIDGLGIFNDGLIIPNKINKIIDNPLRGASYCNNYKMDDKTWFISIRHRKNAKRIFLGTGVESINFLAFKNCVKLENVYIPRNVKSIKNNAFSNTPKLKNIYLFRDIKYIDYGAFDFRMHEERAYRSYNIYYEGTRDEFSQIGYGNFLMTNNNLNITYNVSVEDAKAKGVLVEYSDLLEGDKVYDVNTNWDDYFDNEPDGDYAQSVSEGLIKSIRKNARVDIDYISAICRTEPSEVIKKLGKSIYLDPESFNGNYYEGWKTSDEYLSGNIFNKLKMAKKYNELYPNLFDANIKSLKELLPVGISNDNIYYQISSPWIPKEIIKKYIMYLLGVSEEVYDEYVRFDNDTTLWKISTKIKRFIRRQVTNYSTSRVDIVELLNKVLNLSDIKVYDEIYTFDIKKNKEVVKHKLNYDETMLAEEKGKLLENDFHFWCEHIGSTINLINKRYNELFGYTVNRRFDGSFLDFSDMNPKYTLQEHQKNAVARILFTPNTLLAHDVGTGKTYVIASAIMQLRKTGISKKNLVVVPNSIIGQWRDIFLELYPNANLYVVAPKDFGPAKRKQVLTNIINNDYDAIIMGFSSFDLIPPYRDLERRQIKEELNKCASHGKLTSALRERINKLRDHLEEIDDDRLYENIIGYNELGIDRLFVDEAHNYKNIPLDISAQYLRGINTTGSKKCADFLMKVDMTTSLVDGGVIMATGTPITNSISDCFVFQRFLQNGELKLVDINSFNDWIGTFTEKETEVEIDFDSTNYRSVTRLSKFHNLPELATLIANIADFYDNNDEVEVPENDGYIDVKLENTNDLKSFLQRLTERIDNIRSHKTPQDGEEKDNMLKVISDGRKASVDLRLIDRKKYANPEMNKIDALCKNVSEIYEETKDNKSTQLVFLDLSVYQDDFNLYSLIRDELVNNYYIPSGEIKFVHEATTEKERESTFRKVNSGDVRILLGSTQKLGTGVNVQKRLIAIHHVDVPWRPADMVQRNGRIIRQGNSNKNVKIYRYIKEGSFDAYSWQTLEIKQAFINELLSNSIDERTKEDISDVVLDYAEAKALAMGNSKLKDMIVLKNEINRLSIVNQKTKEYYQIKRKNLIEIPSKIEAIKNEIEILDKDINLYNNNNQKLDIEDRRDLREKIDKTLNINVDSNEEVLITNYKGFDMFAPSGMHIDRRFVILKGTGTYFVEIKTKAGCLEMIDNYLDGLTKQKEDKKEEIIKLKEQSVQTKELLNNRKTYDDEINELKDKLKDLERELKIGYGK